MGGLAGADAKVIGSADAMSPDHLLPSRCCDLPGCFLFAQGSQRILAQFLLSFFEYRATALGRQAITTKLLTNVLIVPPVDEKSVVQREFLTGRYIMQCIHEDATAGQFRFADGRAGVIYPARAAPAVASVDDNYLFEIEEKRMSRFGVTIRKATKYIATANSRTPVFADELSGVDRLVGEQSTPVHGRAPGDESWSTNVAGFAHETAQ